MVSPYTLAFIIIVYVVLQLVLILSNKTKTAFIISCIAIFVIVVYKITKVKNNVQSSRTLKDEKDWIPITLAKIDTQIQQEKDPTALQVLHTRRKELTNML